MSNLIFSKARKIRKSRACWGCTEVYPIGTIMDYTVSVDDGSAASAYWCDSCKRVIHKLSLDDISYIREGVDFGELKKIVEGY